MTKPFLSRSNGMEARSGSSEVERAVSPENPATPNGVMQLSVPPATMTSASPCWIARIASPMEFVPDAHAVTTLMFFPFKPNWMDTFPAAILLIMSGTRSGFTRFGPFSRSFLYSFSMICKLPIPELTQTPTRNGSSFVMSREESSIAWRAAATANCAKRSILLAAFGSI